MFAGNRALATGRRTRLPGGMVASKRLLSLTGCPFPAYCQIRSRDKTLQSCQLSIHRKLNRDMLSGPGMTAMSEGDKSGVAEPEKSVIQGEEASEAAEPSLRGGYRGYLNGAYQKWREGGKPEDPAHPLTEKLLSEAELFMNRMLRKAARDYPALIKANSMQRLGEANQKSFQRAITLYDSSRKASFTTYLKKAVLNNIRQEFRRLLRPTHQEELLRAWGGDVIAAAWWINYKQTRWVQGGKKQVTRVNVKPKDRPIALWMLEHPHIKITWRHVVSQFPEHTEDTAGRALKRIKVAVEQAGFYNPLKKNFA
jgi:hypothetical protein